MKVDEDLQAKWQRKWRTESGKIGATIYLNRHEIDILDWLAHRVMDADTDAEEKAPRRSSFHKTPGPRSKR